MKGPKDLLETEDYWSTRMGLVFPGERVVFRGKDLFRELNDMRWMELFLFAITARRFSREQVTLLEGMWVLCSSYPDPRIWNNRVAALAGTTRSTGTLGLSAANGLSEATIYGRRPDVRIFEFLNRSLNLITDGHDLISVIKSELLKHRGIPGYARPIVNEDERIAPLMALASKLGFDKGLFVKHAFDIEATLLRYRYRMKMNIAALCAALAADQGLSSKEYYHYLLPCFIGGIVPCFIDATEHKEGTFLPIRCSRVNYTGTRKRGWK